LEGSGKRSCRRCYRPWSGDRGRSKGKSHSTDQGGKTLTFLLHASIKAEIYLDTNLHGDRHTILTCRFKAPGSNRVQRLLVQAETKRAHDMQIARVPVGAYDQGKQDAALKLGAARFL